MSNTAIINKSIRKMKRALFIALCGFNALVCIAQVPNGNFEEWQTVDSIENPVHWSTNNYYVGYTPVAKTADAIEGSYSMKISSSARDIFGNPTGDGCAHIKFVPTEEYKYLTASVRIDTVDPEGEVSIRVKQWQPGSGLFEKIGTWKDTATTNGVVQVALPIEQVGLDTLLIEIWAKENHDPFEFPLGYTEAIVDKLKLETNVPTNNPMRENEFIWSIFPNPAAETINIQLNQPILKLCSLRLFDLNGSILEKYDFPSLMETSLDIAGYPPGFYFLELGTQGEVLGHSKIAIEK
jgi:hypothetical protein